MPRLSEEEREARAEAEASERAESMARLRRMSEIQLRKLKGLGVGPEDVEFLRLGWEDAIGRVKSSRDVQELMGNMMQTVSVLGRVDG